MLKSIRSIIVLVVLFIAHESFALQPAHGPESPAPTTRIEQLPADVQRMVFKYDEIARINETIKNALSVSDAINSVNTLVQGYVNPTNPEYYTIAIEQINRKFPNNAVIDSQNRLIVANQMEDVIHLNRFKHSATGTNPIIIDLAFNPAKQGDAVIRPATFNMPLEKLLGISIDSADNSITIKFLEKERGGRSGIIQNLKIKGLGA